MGITPISTPEKQKQAPINHFGRIPGALFSPKATFQGIAAARAGSRQLCCTYGLGGFHPAASGEEFALHPAF